MDRERFKVNLGVFIALVSFFIIAYVFGQTLTPFVAAALFAYVLNPAVGALERRKVPRGVAVGIFIAIFFLIAVGALTTAVVIINNEVHQLIANMPGYVDTFETRYLPRIARYFGVAENVNVRGLATEFKARLMEVSPESIKSAGIYAARILSGTVGFFLAVLNLLLIPVLMAYLMLDFERMRTEILDLLPRPHKDLILAKLAEVEDVLKVFVKGQLMVALTMGVLYSIGLLLVGIDMPVLIGMGAGILNLVPYLGGTLGILTALALAVLKFHDILHPAMVLLVFLVVQTVEGYILTPKIVGNRLGLHPVIVLLALVVLGQMMGFVGVLLAVPIAAVLKVFVVGFMKDYKASEMYAGRK
jgi:predicted PurR-regulated permease PerM